ncbi:MAG: asparagine synthase-related protein, partial [Miltoncostaeaceae bacterium]
VYTTEEANELLPTVIRSIESFEPSLVRSAVPNFMLAELASRHVKVVLTGEGADEIFAGYDYLDRYEDPQALHDELRRLIGSLHSLNLQRCDRVTMAHGLEARVPFLDRDLIAFGMRLPAAWKLRSDDKPEKLLLRMAFEDMLPHDIVWRRKEEFGDGSGAADALRDPGLAESVGGPEGERHDIDPPLRTREELGYYRMFQQALEGIRADRTVGRFPVA